MKPSLSPWIAAGLLVARVGAAQTPSSVPVPVPIPVPVPAPTPAPTTTSVQPPADAAPASPTGSPPPAATPGSVVPAATTPSAPGLPIEFTSLRLMREKGILSQAEYDAAVRDLTETTGQRAPDQGTVVVGKWATTIYGMVAVDNIYDTTRSFLDTAQNSLVARSETQAGQNGRYTMSVRDSRIGFRLKAPAIGAVRTSALFESDFRGNQPPLFTQVSSGGISEGNFFVNPGLRIRNFYFEVQTPVVDFLVGQYWQLFGWQHLYRPNTVEIQGVPGQLNVRTPQIRLSKKLDLHPLTIELAVAATRPVQRDAATPDGVGGIRLALDTWTGVQTIGRTGTTVSPLSVAASGLLRHVAVDSLSASPKTTNDLTLSALAIEGFLPVIPGTSTRKDNSLSFSGEYVTGYGFEDMYSGLSVTPSPTYPALPNPMNTTPAPSFTPDIDNGIVMYDAGGKLHGIQWTSMLVGAQYYLPFTNGTVWISGNYSHQSSRNVAKYLTATAATLPATLAKILDTEDWFDVNLFVDPAPAVRVGIEYACFDDMYFDSHHARSYRGQVSGFFIF